MPFPFLILCTPAIILACDHTPPGDPLPPDPVGPISDAIPRPLTLNPRDDRQPNVTGAVVAFSRLPPERSDKERCLAFLPAAGGTLLRTTCPPPQRSPADTFVDTWHEPVVSPDGRTVAFLWERGAVVSALAAWSHEVAVADLEEEAAPWCRWEVSRILPDGRQVNTIAEPAWVDGHTLRFLLAYQEIQKVKSGIASRTTDTTIVPRWLADLDVATGALTLVPGGDSAIAWAPAPDGGIWLVREPAPTTLLHLAAGAAVPLGDFAGGVSDLASVDGLAVAAHPNDSSIEYWDPVSGTRGTLAAPGVVRRVASVPDTRRVVAELEPATSEFGLPADLWLLEVP